MKFYSEPNHIVLCSNSKKTLFIFDKKGEYITNDIELIERLKPYFKHDETIIEEPKKTRKTTKGR